MIKTLPQLAVFAALALAALTFSNHVHSQEAPDEMVKRITEEVMEIARTDRGVKTGNRERIHELVQARILPHLDFRRGTARTMGHHWRRATPQQRQRLIEEFRALMIHTYAGALSQVGDQKLEFKPLRDDPDDKEVEVRFQVRQPRGGEPVQVSYRLYHSPDGWKVYDVNVLGVWLSETYRNSFSSEIERGGIDGLIRTLEEKNKKLATARAGR
jgi:phospholipid transport system substrate-binding protein